MSDTAKSPSISTKNKTMEILNHPFLKFLGKKAVFYGIVLFVSMTLIFLLPRALPGEPATRILPPKTPAESIEDYETRIEQFNEFYGLNKPIGEQYVDFWRNLFKGDLGPSFTNPGQNALEVLGPAVLFTFAIIIPVVLISFFLGNYIGASSAYAPKSVLSKVWYYVAMLSQSTPFYWLAIIFFWFFVFQKGWFDYGYAGAGSEPSFSFSYISELARYYVLPFLTLLIGFTGGWATGMRSMTLYELNSSYLLYSKQLGFKDTSIRKYAQRNAILPQVTGLNLRLGDAIGATLVLEWVFGWPGVGDILLNSALSADFPLLMASSIILLIVVVVGNFIIDILYGFIDPRIQTGDGN
ncbi:MAG: ABC transporter permease [Candidatus Kariarchaeaceae archaeon]|jgi:peptide/nickel transport system permease protein